MYAPQLAKYVRLRLSTPRSFLCHFSPKLLRGFNNYPIANTWKREWIVDRYNRIMELFRWMGIDGASLLYGLGHIDNACNQIDALIK